MASEYPSARLIQPIGIFGGRFDPVHRAHAAMAQAAADQLALPEIRWVVSGYAVHKAATAAASDRLAMTRLALQDLGDRRMVADDREVRKSERGEQTPSYKTVASFQADYPGRTLVWILGEDQLVTFTEWQRWEWLVQQMVLAVCARPVMQTPHANPRGALAAAGAQIIDVQFSADPVSATDIRTRTAQGLPIESLVTASVARYIHTHRLYAPSQKTGEPL